MVSQDCVSDSYIFFFGGILAIISAIDLKNYVIGILGTLFLIASTITAIIYTKINYSAKYSLSLALLMLANYIDEYKASAEKLRGITKKKILFYLSYINNYFEKQSGPEFFDKDTLLFEKFSSLAKRINFAVNHNQINKYNTSKIKELAWELYAEKEKIYEDIDSILNMIKKELPFKSPQDYFKKFVENKYVKFFLFEALIISIVLFSHFQFPTYVGNAQVFWAIIFLTASNLTINFIKK
ncbi:hypothetical protein HYX04_03455 [Candidatus Woesearchaeota archaeon]|nr:hypothetical protein [Candidatus Woesearchaeota archaeon]